MRHQIKETNVKLLLIIKKTEDDNIATAENNLFKNKMTSKKTNESFRNANQG